MTPDKKYFARLQAQRLLMPAVMGEHAPSYPAGRAELSGEEQVTPPLESIATAPSTNPFAEQRDWLERKRLQTLADIDALRACLQTVRTVPWEERTENFESIFRQAVGCYHTLARLDELQRTWVNRDAA